MKHDLPTSVNGRVISPFREGLFSRNFADVEFHENKTLVKIPEFTSLRNTYISAMTLRSRCRFLDSSNFCLYLLLSWLWALIVRSAVGLDDVWSARIFKQHCGKTSKMVCSQSYQLSRGMRFPTMWYVRRAKAQISLRIRAV